MTKMADSTLNCDTPERVASLIGKLLLYRLGDRISTDGPEIPIRKQGSDKGIELVGKRIDITSIVGTKPTLRGFLADTLDPVVDQLIDDIKEKSPHGRTFIYGSLSIHGVSAMADSSTGCAVTLSLLNETTEYGKTVTVSCRFRPSPPRMEPFLAERWT